MLETLIARAIKAGFKKAGSWDRNWGLKFRDFGAGILGFAEKAGRDKADFVEKPRTLDAENPGTT